MIKCYIYAERPTIYSLETLFFDTTIDEVIEKMIELKEQNVGREVCFNIERDSSSGKYSELELYEYRLETDEEYEAFELSMMEEN